MQRGPLAATKTGTTDSAADDLPPIEVAEPMNLSRFRQVLMRRKQGIFSRR
jgi:hypothetical protein